MILIAEAQSSGHRLVFVRLMMEYLSEIGEDYYLVAPSAVFASEEYREHISSRLGGVDGVDVAPELWGPRVVYGVAREIGASRILVLDGEPFARLLMRTPWLWGRVPLTLLVIHDPEWERSDAGRLPIRALVKSLALKGLNESFFSEVSVKALAAASSDTGSFNSVADPIIIERDLVEIRADAAKFRKTVGMSEGVQWVGIVGVISPYKNLNLLVDALIDVSSKDNPVGLALLGPISEGFHSEIELQRARLRERGIPSIIDDAQRSNDQVNVDVAALDVVSVLYSVNCTNSTMAKAAALGVRTIAAGPPGFRRIYGETTGLKAAPLDRGLVALLLAETLERPYCGQTITPQPHRFGPQVLGR